MLIKYSGKYVKIYFNMKITFYTQIFSFIFLSINFNHFLTKLHKPDFLIMINSMARNFS